MSATTGDSIFVTSHPLFINHRGVALTRFGVRYILNKRCETANDYTANACDKVTASAQYEA